MAEETETIQTEATANDGTKERKSAEAPVIVPSAELRVLLNKAREAMGLTGSFSIPSLPSIGISDLSVATLLEAAPTARKEIIRTTATKQWASIKVQIDEQIHNLPMTVANAVTAIVFKMIDELIDQYISPYDSYIVEILTTYNSIVRLYRKIQDFSKSEEQKKELKEQLYAKLINIVTQLPYVADAIALYMLFDTLVKMIRNLRDAKSASGDQYEETAAAIVTQQEILSQEFLLGSTVVTTILYVLNILLPLIKTLAAIFSTSHAYDEKYNEEAQLVVEENNSHNETPKRISDGEETTSEIETFAQNNQMGFSYLKDQKNEETSDDNYKAEVEIGTIYSILTEINGIITWISNDHPNVTTKTKRTDDRIAVTTPYGYQYGIITNATGDYILTITDGVIDLCHSDIDYTNMCNIDSATLPDVDKPIGAFLEIDKNANYSWNGLLSISYNDQIGSIDEYKILSPVEGSVSSTDKNVSLILFENKTADDYAEEAQRIADSISGNISDTDLSGDISDIVDKFDKLNKIKTVLREYVLYMKLPFIPIDLNNTSKRMKSIDYIWKMYTKKIEKNLNDYQEEVEKITGKDNIEATLNGSGMLTLKEQILSSEKKFYEGIISIFEEYLESQNIYCQQEITGSYSLISHYMDILEKIDYDANNEYVVRLYDMIKNFIFDRQQLESISKQEYIDSLNDICDKVIKPKWSFDRTYKDQFDLIMQNTNENKSTDPIYDFLVTLMDCAETPQQTVTLTTIDDLSNLPEPAETDTDSAALRAQLKIISKKYSLISVLSDKVTVKTLSDKDRLKRLRHQTIKERNSLHNFYETLKLEYAEASTVLDDSTYDIFKQATVTKKQNVYYNGNQYEHYFITKGYGASTDPEVYHYDDPVNVALCDSDTSARSKGDPNTLGYWLIYCAQATLAHCMLPQYWSTGVLIAGVPTNLPVIYIPIYYLGGSVSMLFGLGVCGMFIYPMILMLNFNVDARSILQPINMAVDAIRKILMNTVNLASFNMKEYATTKANNSTKEFDSLADEQEQIDVQILDLKEQIAALGKARKELSKKRKEKREEKKAKKNAETTTE